MPSKKLVVLIAIFLAACDDENPSPPPKDETPPTQVYPPPSASVSAEPTTPDYLLAKTMKDKPEMAQIFRASAAMTGVQPYCKEPIEQLVPEVISLEKELHNENGLAANSVEMLELTEAVFNGTKRKRNCIAFLRHYGASIKKSGHNHVQAGILLRQVFLNGLLDSIS